MIELLFKMMSQDILLGQMEFVLDHFKTQEMCNEAVCREPYTLRFIPDDLKM